MAHVRIYTRAFCIWCWKAKRLLRKNGVTFEEFDASAEDVRGFLLERTGRRTVPQVFAGEDVIGGYDDLAALVGRGELGRRLGGVESPA